MTTIKLNLHELFVRAFGGEIALVPATINLAEALEFADAADPECNIHDLLASENKIAIIWCVDDVRHIRGDLSVAQAWDVLESVRNRHDATLGVTWETLTAAAEALFGTANKLRADRFKRALNAYDEPEPTDLLADALHWCQTSGTSFDEALRLARLHFDAETDSE